MSCLVSTLALKRPLSAFKAIISDCSVFTTRSLPIATLCNEEQGLPRVRYRQPRRSRRYPSWLSSLTRTRSASSWGPPHTARVIAVFHSVNWLLRINAGSVPPTGGRVRSCSNSRYFNMLPRWTVIEADRRVPTGLIHRDGSDISL